MRVIFYSIPILSLLVAYSHAAGHEGDEETECSTENLDSDSTSFQTCLAKIGDIFTDNSRFYFGTDYQQICGQDLFSIPCFLPPDLASRNYSMRDLLFPGQQRTLDLQAFISLEFHVHQGDSYSGCDTTVTFDEDKHFHIDPTSDEVYEPFVLRDSPEYTLHVSPGESIDTSAMYTIIIQDVDNYFFHMVHTNVMFNSDSSVAQMTYSKPYNGPRDSREATQPYAVMVFQQQAEIAVSQEWTLIISNAAGVNSSLLQSFIDTYNLQGPLALSWMLVSYDIYSVQLQKESFGIIENCAPFVEEALREHPRPWLSQLLPEESSLSLFVSTAVKSDSFSFDFCCENYRTEAETVMLNPINSTMFSTVQVRTGVDVMFTVTANKYFPTPADFADRHFTMVAVDSDMPAEYSSIGSADKPFVHMIAVNIAVNNLSMLEFKTEDILTSWYGPSAADSLQHTLYFLLMEQLDGELDITSDDLIQNNILAECPEEFGLGRRCQFDVTAFASEYNLNLVGATWFKYERDPYANYVWGVTSDCRENAQQGECELYHVDKYLREHDRPWVPEILPDDQELSVSLDISVDTLESLSYTFCCDLYFVGRKWFDLDPITDEIYDTAVIRTGSQLEYVISSRDDLTNKLFTILSVDPDIPTVSTYGSNERPLVHMLAINGEVRKMANGDFQLEDFDYLTPWKGPSPPNVEETTHRYYFLLMEQEGPISPTNEDLEDLKIAGTSGCPERLPGGCLFDVPTFASTYNLNLVGATWFRSQNDPYVNFRREDYSTCNPSRRDPDNCPVSSANRSKVTEVVLMLAILVKFWQI